MLCTLCGWGYGYRAMKNSKTPAPLMHLADATAKSGTACGAERATSYGPVVACFAYAASSYFPPCPECVAATETAAIAHAELPETQAGWDAALAEEDDSDAEAEYYEMQSIERRAVYYGCGIEA